MKDFIRNDLLFSLCGLNCGLCPMHLDGHCPGCGGGEGNQSCEIAECSLQREKTEYCSRCRDFPCKKYKGIVEFDLFITLLNQMKNFGRMEKIGTEAYQAEQNEKIKILKTLLEYYNDGRKKTFFCVAVNLLELCDLKKVLQQIESAKEPASLKEKAERAVSLFQAMAKQKKITLTLRSKPDTTL